MRIRKSTKRLKTDTWRPWQVEEYVGVHEACEWVPAENAQGYQFRPVFVVPSPPVDQSRYVTPQLATRGIKEEVKLTIWERIKKWATA